MQPAYRLQASTGIHRGDREYQQDQVMLMAHPYVHGCLLGVVADGMGGRSGGRKASDQVMLTARQLFERFDPRSENCVTLLESIVQDSHTVIRLTALSAEQEPHSTIAAFIMLPQGRCHWVHSGDSRIYHYAGATMMHRTKDHSYVQALVDRGEITEFEAHVHPKSNILLGCLGTEAPPPMTHHVIERMRPGDTLMACSDGIWHYYTSEELGTVLHALTPREATEFLIDKARMRARGTGDNLSLVVLKLEALEGQAGA
ncbi:PP2C family protein-serine/threonine phosphatase [Delftia sp. PS-11]|uniref:PP2C family protein-serine/threonine phosphatase n=1 Tax=Delftia sp. PS-11 TaxID=2767222 RepID=UPI0024554D5B|nr:protein phosphatase 2C domain-containing protein [Delftia sp. PS-11]KAJ8743818.1 serine/threonine-protein phosphatase [Delftia sp. PS-11]